MTIFQDLVALIVPRSPDINASDRFLSWSREQIEKIRDALIEGSNNLSDLTDDVVAAEADIVLLDSRLDTAEADIIALEAFDASRRERLTANRTYYVRTDGNNANSGLVNDSSGAWATGTYAYSFIRDNLDLNGFTVIVQFNNGTHTTSISCAGAAVGQTQPSNIIFRGDTATPSNCVISTTNSSAITCVDGAAVTFEGFQITTTTSGHGFVISRASNVFLNSLNFSTIANSGMVASALGKIILTGAYTISGNAQRHFHSTNNGYIQNAGSFTITTSGTPAFSNQFALSTRNGFINIASTTVTFAGTGATGQRHVADNGGGIDTNGGGTSYFPGNSAGSVTSPGWYL